MYMFRYLSSLVDGLHVINTLRALINSHEYSIREWVEWTSYHLEHLELVKNTLLDPYPLSLNGYNI